MYRFLDWFLDAFHGLWVLFNLFGWAWRPTRRIHLATIGLTVASWFGLGLFYGWGYCPSTDWHWSVKRELGEVDLPDSYIKYHVDRLTGLAWDPLLVDLMVLIAGVALLAISLWLNRRDAAFRRQKKPETCD